MMSIFNWPLTAGAYCTTRKNYVIEFLRELSEVDAIIIHVLQM